MQSNYDGSKIAEFTSLHECDVPFLQLCLWIVVIRPTSAITKPNLLYLSLNQAARWLGSFDGFSLFLSNLDDGKLLSFCLSSTLFRSITLSPYLAPSVHILPSHPDAEY